MKTGFYITHIDVERAENGYYVTIAKRKDALRYSENNFTNQKILFEFSKYSSEEETKEAALSKVKECYREKLDAEDQKKKSNPIQKAKY